MYGRSCWSEDHPGNKGGGKEGEGMGEREREKRERERGEEGKHYRRK